MTSNYEPLRNLAFSAPEKSKLEGGQKARYVDLPQNFTTAERDHWSDVMTGSNYFRLRAAGFSPRQIAAMAEWRIQ